MILPNILKYIKGFVRFEISGDKITQFLNNIMKDNIYIWNISKINNKFYINTSIKDYISLHKIAKGYNVKLKINQRYGLPFIINKYKKRIGLLIGLIIFISFLIIMSQFIWTIEVHGNKNIDVNKLISFISDRKIYPGKYRKNIDIKSIERETLLKFKNISWISINIVGSKANIEINERTPPPNNPDKGSPCNIIASKKGIIKHVEAYNGQNLVDIGDFVEKNQILVSGIMEDKSLNNTLVHAKAKAIAQVKENIKYSQPLFEHVTQYKNISTNLYVEIFNQQIPINFTKKIDGKVKQFHSTIYPKILNISLPITIHKYSNKKTIQTPIYLSANDAKSKLIKKIKQSESNMARKNIKIISKQIITNKVCDNSYIIEIKYITEQDIAKYQEIIIDNIPPIIQ